MDREARQATVHGVAKSQTWGTTNTHFHRHVMTNSFALSRVSIG